MVWCNQKPGPGKNEKNTAIRQQSANETRPNVVELSMGGLYIARNHFHFSLKYKNYPPTTTVSLFLSATTITSTSLRFFS